MNTTFSNWEELQNACENCTKCGLCETRHNVVVGVGNPQAEVMFIGEGPGENEDLQGEPFVGRAGKLLDKMLDAVDLDRHKNIYIANIVKCRPPQNRDPKPEEQEQCIDWLRAQVRMIRPVNGTRDFKGVLESYDDGNITVRFDSGDGLTFTKKETGFIKLDDFEPIE